MTEQEEKEVINKIRRDLLDIGFKMSEQYTLLNIVDKINNFRNPYRITVKHAKCNGLYKPVVYTVISSSKIKEIHPLLGTYNTYSKALISAIEYFIYNMKQDGKDFIN